MAANVTADLKDDLEHVRVVYLARRTPLDDNEFKLFLLQYTKAALYSELRRRHNLNRHSAG